ncbi:hypothetical protein [Nocardioides salsibiostraticola]
MLQGRRFRRIHPRVWALADASLTHSQHIEAARLALPADARLTGITRLQDAGLSFGPRFPMRFVVARDHHLALDDIFVHRTKVMPPCDERSVSPFAAFLAYCALARVIDAIKVGDWLMGKGLCDPATIEAYALANLWRPGADEAIWILPYLSGESRSFPESDTRAIVTFAGLPVPEVNVRVPLEDPRVVIADLLLRPWRTVIEYEGSQHQVDRRQYISDIDRYAVLRREDYAYVQVTHETVGRPQQVALDVHRALVQQGYAGPAPEFGNRWRQLFGSVTLAVGERPALRRAPVS